MIGINVQGNEGRVWAERVFRIVNERSSYSTENVLDLEFLFKEDGQDVVRFCEELETLVKAFVASRGSHATGSGAIDSGAQSPELDTTKVYDSNQGQEPDTQSQNDHNLDGGLEGDRDGQQGVHKPPQEPTHNQDHNDS